MELVFSGMLTWTPAEPDDAPAILALMEQFYREEHLEFDADATGGALCELLAQQGPNSPGRVFLLVEGCPRSEPRGYLVLTMGFSLEFHGRYAVLDEIYLTPACRGMGNGRRAIEFAAGIAKNELNARTLRLEVTNHNQRARALYERSGFRDDDRGTMTRWLDEPSTYVNPHADQAI